MGLSKPRTPSRGPRLRSAASLVPAVEAAIRARAEGGLPGLPTGLSKVDRILGGLRGLVILGGPPGVGKSSLAVQLALYLAERELAAAVFVSLEMGRHEIVTRLLAHASGSDLRDVAVGRLMNDAAYASQYREGLGRLERAGKKLCILSRRGASSPGEVLKASRRAARAIAPNAPALVVIDSLQVAAEHWATQRRSTAKERLDTATSKLSEMTASGTTTVLAISHITKESAESPGQFAFSGSGGIDFLADTTLILQRDSGRTTKAPTRTRLKVTKNRNGPLGEVVLSFDGPTLTFRERGAK